MEDRTSADDDWYLTKDQVKVRNWRRYFDENSRRRFQEARRSVEIHFQLPVEDKEEDYIPTGYTISTAGYEEQHRDLKNWRDSFDRKSKRRFRKARNRVARHYSLKSPDHRPSAVRDRNKVGRRLTWHGDARRKKPQNEEEKTSSDSSSASESSDTAENDIQQVNERISSEKKVTNDSEDYINAKDTSSWQQTFSPQSQRRFSEARENIEDYYLQQQTELDPRGTEKNASRRSEL